MIPLADLVTVVPTITAGSYASGKIVGNAQAITLPVMPSNLQAGILDNLAVLDNANQAAPLTLIFFSVKPTVVDTASFAWSASIPFANVLGIFNVLNADYVVLNSKAMVSYHGISMALKAAAGQTVYVVVVTTGTPTYGTVHDLTFLYGMMAG